MAIMTTRLLKQLKWGAITATLSVVYWLFVPTTILRGLVENGTQLDILGEKKMHVARRKLLYNRVAIRDDYPRSRNYTADVSQMGQERILSTRRLHWTTAGLMWECSSGAYRENELLRNLRQRPQTFPGAQRDAFTDQILSLPKEETLGFAWFVLMELHSEMKSTVISVCLAAIHGIASRLSLLHNEKYLDGPFKTYDGQGLAWTSQSYGEVYIQGVS